MGITEILYGKEALNKLGVSLVAPQDVILMPDLLLKKQFQIRMALKYHGVHLVCPKNDANVTPGGFYCLFCQINAQTSQILSTILPTLSMESGVCQTKRTFLLLIVHLL